MALEEYKSKRDFRSTPEPGGIAAGKKKGLRFVVQRHKARRLHYDLRLEMDGVLKSWAVPKGPSMNPVDKRLAIHTEDHPVKYLDFEGIIPKGNYGAGEMRIWDRGTYKAASTDKKKGENLTGQMEKGNLKIILSGEKLKGEFALFSMGKEDLWLLVKKPDDHATNQEYDAEKLKVIDPGDEETGPSGDVVSEKTGKSSKTGKSGISGTSTTSIPSVDLNKASDNTSDKTSGKSVQGSDTPDIGKRGEVEIFDKIKPMLAKKTTGIFDDPGWLYEMKWDGYRAIANINDGKVQLYSRNGHSYNKKFPPVVRGLETIPHNAVLDGEIVLLDKNGKPVFQNLQNYSEDDENELLFYVFDLLHLNGHSATGLPIEDRKSLIPGVIGDAPNIRYCDHVKGSAKAYFEKAIETGMEGVIAKKAGSRYFPGRRSDSWLKIKALKSQEALICGYTEGKRLFGSLILGVYDDDRLVYIGNCGTGFGEETQRDLLELLEPLKVSQSPFDKKINLKGRKAVWVRPEVICEVAFSEWTDSGSLRHPVFKGVRKDKKPEEIMKEKEVKKPTQKRKKGTKTGEATSTSASESKSEGRSAAGEKTDRVKGKEKGSKSGTNSDLETTSKSTSTSTSTTTSKSKSGSGKDTSSSQKKQPSQLKGKNTLDIDGTEVAVTNLDKVYWPDEGYTKYDLIEYYMTVSEVMMPYLVDRPQNLNRHPNGIDEDGFYQKDSGSMPDWIETVSIHSESTGKDIEYMLCQNRAALAYMANLGCIEINPWNSRTQSPDHPDYTVIDIDPASKTTFEEVIEVTLASKEVLDRAKIDGYCKTSGSRGIHIYLPMGAKYTYEEARNFTRLLCYYVRDMLPELTTMERSLKKRKGKIYLDFLQNRSGQTLAAPYCLRPKKGATASAPLKWSEVKQGLDMRDFNIRTMPDRIKALEDPFKKVLGEGIDIAKTLKVLGVDED